MKRPTGISVLALLLLLNGIFNAVHAAILYSNPDIGARFANAYLKVLFPIDRGDAAGVLFASMVGGIVALALGAGLWFLQDPARWGMLLVTGIPLGRGLISAVACLALDPSQFGRHFGEGFWLRSLVYGGIVLYLIRPDVQVAFGARREYYDEYAPTDSESRSRN